MARTARRRAVGRGRIANRVMGAIAKVRALRRRKGGAVLGGGAKKHRKHHRKHGRKHHRKH